MKKPTPRHSRSAHRASVHGAERQLQAAPRAQRSGAPDLFPERDDDDAEFMTLLRDFESVREERLGAERDR